MTIRSCKIYAGYIAKHGVTAGCPGCRAITTGKQPQSHKLDCRVRIEEAIAETAEGKLRLTRKILRKDAPRLQILISKEDEEESEKSPRSPRLILEMFQEVVPTQGLRLGQMDDLMTARLDQAMEMETLAGTAPVTP